MWTSCVCVPFVVRLTILCFACSSWNFAWYNSFLVFDSSERKKKSKLLFIQYFPISDLLKSPSLFFISSWSWPNLEDPSKIPSWILPKQSRFTVNIPAINLVSRRVNLKDPKTKTVQNIFKNTQKILVDGCYWIFQKYSICKKKHLFISETVPRNRPKFRRKSTRRQAC